MVGTSIVTDIDEALEILSEGGGAYQLFGTCAQKINLLNHQIVLKWAFAPTHAQKESCHGPDL